MKIGFWGDVYQATSYSVDISEVVIETKDVDFNVVNLEGVICDFDICNGIEKTGPILRCDSSVLDNLENMKVRLISLANNHAGDYGSEGINQTCIHLQKKSINYIGVGCDIEESYRAFRIEKDGVKVAILATCENEFGTTEEVDGIGTAGYIPEQFLKRVGEEKKDGYRVIVFFHGGSEYNPFPSPKTVQRYRSLIDNGVDAVVATHTHCMQGFEYYKNGFISYSLGNFIFERESNCDNDLWNDGYGCIMEFDERIRAKIVPYHYDFRNRKIEIKKEDYSYIDRLNEISRILKNREVINRLFTAWSLFKSGVLYSNVLKKDNMTPKNVLEILNVFRCESHNELLQKYFSSVFDDEYQNKTYYDYVNIKYEISPGWEKKYMSYTNSKILIDYFNDKKFAYGINGLNASGIFIVLGCGCFGKEIMKRLEILYPEGTKYYFDNNKTGVVDNYNIINFNEIPNEGIMVIGSLRYGEDFVEQLLEYQVEFGRIVIPIEVLKSEIEKEDKAISKRLLKKRLRFVVDISEHCNLNCKYCDHFSPLSEVKFADLEQFRKDIARISELFVGDYSIYAVNLEGGEPLLNKDVCRYVEIVHEYLSEAKVSIFTNGTLIKKMTEDFWKSCKEHNVSLMVTKYPIPFDYEGVRSLAMDKGVNLEFWSGGDLVKEMDRKPINLNADSDVEDSFSKCYMGNDSCTTLRNGKIFLCTFAANIERFGNYFNLGIKNDSKDYMDIYQVKSAEEIMNYVCNPIPCCRYCQPDNWEHGHEWEISKREIEEWV